MCVCGGGCAAARACRPRSPPPPAHHPHPPTHLPPRWYRDPGLPIHRTEITRFPHAVLEIKLALSEGEQAPEWVTELVDSGLVTEVHKFSK